VKHVPTWWQIGHQVLQSGVLFPQLPKLPDFEKPQRFSWRVIVCSLARIIHDIG